MEEKWRHSQGFSLVSDGLQAAGHGGVQSTTAAALALATMVMNAAGEGARREW